MIDPSTLMIVTIGLPRSGKSTWAKKMAKEKGYAIVNPDAIRLALHGQAFYGDAEPMVWGIAQTMTRALYEAGHRGVIIDATNTTEKRRIMWRMMHPRIIWAVFDVPLEVCIARAKEGDNSDLFDIIMRMHKAMEPLRDEDQASFIDQTGNRLKHEPSGWRKSPDFQEGSTV